MNVALHAADAAPLTAEALRALAPGAVGDLALDLHPSVTLLRSPWPVDRIWRANQPGAEDAVPAMLALVEGKVLQHQVVHFGARKTGVCLIRRADDGFSPHVERGVDEDRTSGQPPESRDQVIIKWVVLPPDSLHTGRVVYVGDRGDG